MPFGLIMKGCHVFYLTAPSFIFIIYLFFLFKTSLIKLGGDLLDLILMLKMKVYKDRDDRDNSQMGHCF